MTFSRRNLPHISHPKTDFFLTYRQNGTYPASGKTLTNLGILTQPEITSIIKKDWFERDGKEVNLHAFCIMGDHVHVVLSTLDETSITRIIGNHKRFTGLLINRKLGKEGAFWQAETFDRVLRDGKLDDAIRYTLENPVKACYVKNWRDWAGTYVSPMHIDF